MSCIFLSAETQDLMSINDTRKLRALPLNTTAELPPVSITWALLEQEEPYHHVAFFCLFLFFSFLANLLLWWSCTASGSKTKTSARCLVCFVPHTRNFKQDFRYAGGFRHVNAMLFRAVLPVEATRAAKCKIPLEKKGRHEDWMARKADTKTEWPA